MVSLTEHPSSVAVNVYKVVCFGLAEGFSIVASDKSPAGVHEYVACEALPSKVAGTLNGVVIPGPASTVGEGLTITSFFLIPIHPVELVAVSVTV